MATVENYNGVDLRKILALDSDGDIVDAEWEGYRVGSERYARVRRLDDQGSTQETSLISLEPDGDNVLCGELMFVDNLALRQLQRKLRSLRTKTSGGVLACDAGAFEFWF